MFFDEFFYDSSDCNGSCDRVLHCREDDFGLCIDTRSSDANKLSIWSDSAEEVDKEVQEAIHNSHRAVHYTDFGDFSKFDQRSRGINQ